MSLWPDLLCLTELSLEVLTRVFTLLVSLSNIEHTHFDDEPASDGKLLTNELNKGRLRLFSETSCCNI